MAVLEEGVVEVVLGEDVMVEVVALGEGVMVEVVKVGGVDFSQILFPVRETGNVLIQSMLCVCVCVCVCV